MEMLRCLKGPYYGCVMRCESSIYLIQDAKQNP